MVTVECPLCQAKNNVAGLRPPEPWRMERGEVQVRCYLCRKVFEVKEPEHE